MFLYVIEKDSVRGNTIYFTWIRYQNGFFGSLGGDISEYKIHGIQGFFKAYFCLYKYDNTIDWDMLYKETLKNKRITAANRGYEPAIQLKELAENINSLFMIAKEPIVI